MAKERIRKFKPVRRSNRLYLANKQFNLTNLIPHIGMALLVILVLVGSSFNRQGYFSSYASLRQSILEPGEIKVIALSLDKYTPFIKESQSEFIQSLEGGPLTTTTAQGYIDQPQLALATTNGLNGHSGRKPKSELISHYRVRRGDTISKIAQRFFISVNTLRWANHLSNLDYLRPGQRLVVPRRNGVWYTIRPGEALSMIVRRLNGNLKSTLAFNGLGKGNKVYRHQKVLIIGGKKPIPSVASAVSYSSYSRPSYQPRPRYHAHSSYNRFSYGWCTWYVASRRNISWSGNAGAWLYNARAVGYPTGYSPSPGAIMVTGESAVGHVAYVEAVYGNMIKVSEMNYRGWGIVSTRTLSAHSSFIWGYIY